VTDSGFVLADMTNLYNLKRKVRKQLKNLMPLKRNLKELMKHCLANGKVKAPTRTGRKQTTYLPILVVSEMFWMQ